MTQLCSLEHASAPRPPRRRQQRLKAWLHRAAHRPSLFRHVAPYYLAVSDANRAIQQNTKRLSVLDSIWRRLNLAESPLKHPLTISQTGVAIAQSSDATGRQVMVRIPLSEAGQGCVDRNAETLLRLCVLEQFAPRFRRLIPELTQQIDYRGLRITAESKLAGKPLLRGASDDAMVAWSDVAELTQALTSLAGLEQNDVGAKPQLSLESLSSSPTTTRERLESRFQPLNRWLARDEAHHSRFVQVERMTKWLARHMTHWAPAHGDCHPGNILVERSGRVSGVIDWDRGLVPEPVGLDMLKFAIRTSGDGARKVSQAPWSIQQRMRSDLSDYLASRDCSARYVDALRLYYMLRLASEQVDHPLVSQRQQHWALSLVTSANQYLEKVR